MYTSIYEWYIEKLFPHFYIRMVYRDTFSAFLYTNGIQRNFVRTSIYGWCIGILFRTLCIRVLYRDSVYECFTDDTLSARSVHECYTDDTLFARSVYKCYTE